VSSAPPTVRLGSAVYGHEGPALDDPVELLHEASKLQPSLLARQMRGVALLTRNPGLRASSGRAVRRHSGLQTLALPRTDLPQVTLAAALRERRSTRSFSPDPLELDRVAALLRGAYGVTRPAQGELPPLRTVPSAGGLYPLELFLLARNVRGLPPGVFHYDPLAHGLDAHPPAPSDLPPLFSDGVADGAALIVFVTAVFWRSRFKYGLRAYRFTLLEAGHVAQNLVLSAAACGLGSVLLGSFYDARVESLLGLNGVDEAALIAVCLGQSA